MKKILLVAVVISLALTAKAFAEEKKAEATKAPEAKAAVTATTPAKVPTTTTAPAKPETKTPTVASTETSLKGNITKLDNANLVVKDNAGKEWTFKVGTIGMKEYKVGDTVEVKYEKDNLKSIAKAK